MLTGVGATAMTVTGLQVQGSFKDDQIAAVAAYQTATGMELDKSNACSDASARSGPEAQAVVDACDAGKSRASLSNIFLGASIVTAVAAGYFYYKGLRGAEGIIEQGAHESSAQACPTRHHRGAAYRTESNRRRYRPRVLVVWSLGSLPPTTPPLTLLVGRATHRYRRRR